MGRPGYDPQKTIYQTRSDTLAKLRFLEKQYTKFKTSSILKKIENTKNELKSIHILTDE